MKQANVSMNVSNSLKRLQEQLSPPQIIALSFLLIIVIGGLLLSLPISHQPNVEVSLIDAFFTAVSAVCVTGLVTLTTASTWSFFGKLVILLLIQTGGLSLITILTYFMVNTGKKVSLKNRLTIQAAFNHSSVGGMVKMVLLVIKGTFICEAIGAIWLSVSFASQGMIWYQSIFYGVFHSISAFCNAGFDIIGEQSLMPYGTNWSINIVIMALIVIGGIGFTVWKDAIHRFRYKFFSRIKQVHHLSLHTRLALITTIVLIASGAVCFLVAEYRNPATLGELSVPHKLLAALFQSVTLRTAGFATIAQDGLTDASKLISSLLMMVGGSPGGTAGGIKTVTMAIIFCSVWAIIKGRHKIVVFERTISVTTLQKALAITVLMILLLFFSTAILAATEDHTAFPHTIIDLLFEVSSALGTVGLSTGITPHLSGVGKLLLMLCMFVGRLGPITLIISLSHGIQHAEDLVGYPCEDVMIG